MRKSIALLICLLMVFTATSVLAEQEQWLNAYEVLTAGCEPWGKMLLVDGMGYDLVDMGDPSRDMGMTAVLKETGFLLLENFDTSYLEGEEPLAALELDFSEGSGENLVKAHIYPMHRIVRVEAQGFNEAASGYYHTYSELLVFTYGVIGYFENAF